MAEEAVRRRAPERVTIIIEPNVRAAWVSTIMETFVTKRGSARDWFGGLGASTEAVAYMESDESES